MHPSAWLDRLNTLAPAFTDAALRGALVLLLALVISQLMRRRTAAARHLVWVGAILVQLALPVFAIWGPQWNVVVPDQVASVMPVDLREAPAPAIADVPTAAVTTTAGATPSVRAGTQSTASAGPSLRAGRQIATTNQQISGKQLLLALWVIGAAFILARLAIGTSIVASLARKGNRIDDGNWLSLAQRTSAALQIDRPLTLLRGTRLAVPVTWGIVYPVVLLPDDADAWPEERRRFVLVHEMAHVKRFDALTQLAGQFALALFWFNPLVWIANRRMQLEREHACDDYVIRHGTSPSLYAEELLSMVRLLGTPEHRSSQPAFAALAMARRSEFEGRMLSILDPVLDRHPLSKSRTMLSVVAALMLVVPLAALHPYQRATEVIVQRGVATPGEVREPKPANDFPESFKVTLAPSRKGSPLDTYIVGLNPKTRDTVVVLRTPIPNPYSAFATGAESVASALATKATGAKAATAQGCDNIRFGGTGEAVSAHSHTDIESGSSIIDVMTFNGQRCSSAMIVGLVKISASEDAITEMPFGSHASFRERTVSEDHELSLSRTPDGAIQHMYRHNGQVAGYDESARRWFTGYLPTVLIEAGINVGPRVARWRLQGDFEAVLSRIAAMTSSGAKRAHYEALITSRDRLSGQQLDELIRSASQTLTSSGDLAGVLTTAAPRVKQSRQGISAVEKALALVSSSGDKTEVLQAYGQSDDREILLSVARVASTIASSGDRARLLSELAPRYLNKDDRQLETAYFDVVEALPSSGDMQSAVVIAIPYGAHSPEITRRVIKAIRKIPSSGDRASALIAAASSGSVTTKELRDAFFVAANELPSDGDKRSVLQVAARMFR
ncbi:MAG: M56 family metallopeptidase [bacterium]